MTETSDSTEASVISVFFRTRNVNRNRDRRYQVGLAFTQDDQHKAIDRAIRCKAIQRRLKGFFSDETAGICQAIEDKFNHITATLKHLN